VARAQGATTYSWLKSLWINAGGNPADADTMAAIALAESSGNPLAHAYTSKEDSRGLWQVNVYAHPQYEQVDLYNPEVNAKAAVAIRGGGLQNWSTYTHRDYLKYLPGGASQAAGDATIRARPFSATSVSTEGFSLGGLTTPAEGVFNGLVGAIQGPLDVWKAALFLLRPQNWLRMVEFITGAFLMFLGLVGLATLLASRNDTARSVAGVAQALPGPLGLAGKAVTVAGSSQARKATASRAVPQRMKERAASEQGARDERDRVKQKRIRDARERGRTGQRNGERVKALRVEHPNFDEIPF
jgi:hypothetical protein